MNTGLPLLDYVATVQRHSPTSIAAAVAVEPKKTLDAMGET